ncbi:MAG: tyrosine--tRNA ligase [Pseudomonadota bacterium]
MSQYRSEFLQALDARGLIHQLSDPAALDDALAKPGERVISAYIGFDCTAPSLHAGSLVQIMLLRWLQRCGHRPIVLMGGGTTRVGDPSGKDEARKLLTEEQIEANLAGIREVFARYLTFGDGPTDAVMVNNADWLLDLNYIDFLRDYGRHFSVNRMLTMDSVKLRLAREESSLSFLEFNYMILQAYDFAELSRRYDVSLQMGGSDQWGNIVTGIDLGRRVQGAQLFALTTPLLTTSSGAKMGKTASGAVWLNPQMLSPYEFWQYWRNTEDADVGRFLRLFTELPIEEIDQLSALEGAQINEAKKRLATEITTLAHGAESAQQAAETAAQAFEQGAAAQGLPTIEVALAQLQGEGMGILDALRQAGLAGSNSEARRLVTGNAIKVNDEPITDPKARLDATRLDGDGVIKLSAGRKRHALLKPN